METISSAFNKSEFSLDAEILMVLLKVKCQLNNADRINAIKELHKEVIKSACKSQKDNETNTNEKQHVAVRYYQLI